MNFTSLVCAALVTVMAAGMCLGCAASSEVSPAVPRPAEDLHVEVVGERPHDPSAFTEGLVLNGGWLYESTGEYGKSTLREVDPALGSVLRSVELDDAYFGEGIATVDDRVIQLTWKERTAFAYRLSDFGVIETYRYDTEGWGLCDDGARLVMSDGTDRLYFRDRSTFAFLGSVPIADTNGPVDKLNELECVDGEVYANVYQTATIVRIDPANGAVTAVIDAAQLTENVGGAGVMNGIAYDAEAGTFLVTGKHWPSLYEVRFVPI